MNENENSTLNNEVSSSSGKSEKNSALITAAMVIFALVLGYALTGVLFFIRGR